ncbi:TetR family transcriptional regulator [Nonomuraea aridisoli]|uniref:TetR/AcrR family transcriptional regulator n=1 Tax=Nonomuraea aridisoli TaxID=2070368 RepID=UPI001C64B30A
MAARAVHPGRASATREHILTAAERLFAEHGVYAVSNRQVSEAAGQGNNAAVGYHFGTKADLVRAIMRKHAAPMELVRGELVAETDDAAGVREWVTCLVRPITAHLATLDHPTWFARFAAQVMTDPVLRPIIMEEALTSPTLQRIIDGLNRCLPHLPAEVRAERDDMARQLLVHMCAERERALAEGGPTFRSSWHDAGTGLIDAITGLWLAPVTSTEYTSTE